MKVRWNFYVAAADRAYSRVIKSAGEEPVFEDNILSGSRFKFGGLCRNSSKVVRCKDHECETYVGHFSTQLPDNSLATIRLLMKNNRDEIEFFKKSCEFVFQNGVVSVYDEHSTRELTFGFCARFLSDQSMLHSGQATINGLKDVDYKRVIRFDTRRRHNSVQFSQIKSCAHRRLAPVRVFVKGAKELNQMLTGGGCGRKDVTSKIIVLIFAMSNGIVSPSVANWMAGRLRRGEYRVHT